MEPVGDSLAQQVERLTTQNVHYSIGVHSVVIGKTSTLWAWFHTVLTAWLTQDCLENLFSSIRIRNATPTPLEFQRHLRTITVAQFLKRPRNTSYDFDDSIHLLDYLYTTRANDEVDLESMPSEVVIVDEHDDVTLDSADLSSLYYITGE